MEYSIKTTTDYEIKCGDLTVDYTSGQDGLWITPKGSYLNGCRIKTQDLDGLIQALQTITGVIKK